MMSIKVALKLDNLAKKKMKKLLIKRNPTIVKEKLIKFQAQTIMSQKKLVSKQVIIINNRKIQSEFFRICIV